MTDLHHYQLYKWTDYTRLMNWQYVASDATNDVLNTIVFTKLQQLSKSYDYTGGDCI
jgi:hypothetical protein